MPLRTFYWVSQVGMLAGTIVYVNAARNWQGSTLFQDTFTRADIVFRTSRSFPHCNKEIVVFLQIKEDNLR